MKRKIKGEGKEWEGEGSMEGNDGIILVRGEQ
jgi:hypothetical protein